MKRRNRMMIRILSGGILGICIGMAGIQADVAAFANGDEQISQEEQNQQNEEQVPQGDEQERILAGQQGWTEIDGTWYYYDNNGNMCKDYIYRIDNRYYMFDEEGALVTSEQGWYESTNKNHYAGTADSSGFYINSDGSLAVGWKQVDNKWYYFNASMYRNGTYYLVTMYRDGFFTINGKEYYFDSEGVMKRGYMSLDGKQYYFYEDGHMGKGGWINAQTAYNYSGEAYAWPRWYYANAQGELQTGWQKISGTWYYFGETAYMYAEYIYRIDGKYYLFDENGAMIEGPGWYESSNKNLYDGTADSSKFYVNSDGSLATGWKQIDNRWYYFGVKMYRNGTYYLVTMYRDGFFTINGKEYYFDSEGVMKRGYMSLDGKQYYFYEDGHMGKGGWINAQTAYNYSGEAYAWSRWYYANAQGELQTGWQKISGTWYYFDETAYMYAEYICQIDGKYYLFDENGAMIEGSGWYESSNRNYYAGIKSSSWFYINGDGSLATGWKQVNGKWYYFKASMYRNGSYYLVTMYSDDFYQIGGKTYYFDEDGAMKTGWQKIDEKWYYFDKNGAMAVKKWIGNYYLGEEGVMAVDTWIDGYYVGEDGEWIPDYSPDTVQA